MLEQKQIRIQDLEISEKDIWLWGTGEMFPTAMCVNS